MPSPTPQQKLAIGVYVAILAVLILVIWGYFLKDELRTKNSPKSKDQTFAEIKSGWQKFLKASEETFQKISTSLKNLNSQNQEGLEENFVKRVQEELLQKRTADWLNWESEILSFKYPATWLVNPKSFDDEELTSQQITLTSYDEKKQPLSASRVKVEISFQANPLELTANEWWENLPSKDRDLAQATSSQIIINGKSGIKITSEAKQLIYLPLLKQIMELNITFSGKADDVLSQIVDDLIQMIKIQI